MAARFRCPLVFWWVPNVFDSLAEKVEENMTTVIAVGLVSWAVFQGTRAFARRFVLGIRNDPLSLTKRKRIEQDLARVKSWEKS